MTTPAAETAPPWYRQPHVWLVIAFPALSVIAGVTTLVIAVTTFDGLVVDDYYRRGMQINQELGRDQAAAARGLAAAVELEPGAPRFRILLRAAAGEVAPESLHVQFLHRTRAGFDRALPATPVAAAMISAPFVYEAATPDLVRGHWDVLIEAGDWRLLETVVIP